MNWEIYTYGGGEYLYTVFNAVASITQNSSYTGLLAVVAMVGLLWVIIEGAFGKELNYKWLFIMIFVYMGFMVPKADVIVTDRINPAFTRVVANVPLALAVTAGSFSQVGDYLTRTFDTVFALPDDLSYSKTGMLFGQHLMMESTRFQVTDARLARNLSEFWQACVFYDVLLGLYEFDELLSAPDTWEFIKANTSKSRSFAYRTGGAARSEVIGCRAGASGATDDSNPSGHSLTADLTAAIAKAKVYYGQKLGKGATPGEAALQFASALPISYQHLTGMSMTAEQTIRQSWMATHMARGLQSFATRVDAGAAAQDFAVARAETERRTTYAVLGELAGRTLPLIRNIFEAFVYGIFPLVFALMLLPAASKVVMTYLKALLWLQLWAPLYAILHFGMTLYSTRVASSATALLDGGSALSMATNTGLYQALADMSLIAGYMAMSIPMISYLIVNQGGAMMASLAGKVMGSYEAPAAKGAEEATTGNISLGNTSMGNANWWAQNTAPSTNFGTYTHTDGMGTKHTYTQNGGEITQQQVSSYAFSASTGEAVKSSITTQAGQSITAARQDAAEYAQSTASTFSQMQNVAHQVQQSLGTTDLSSRSETAQFGESYGKVMDAAQELSKTHDLSLDTSVAMMAGLNSKLGPKSLNVGVGLDGKAQSISKEAWADAQKIAESSNFSENWGKAQQAALQVSASDAHLVSDTAAQQLQAGIQQNQALSEKASASLQRAESWSRVQARMEEHGFNFTGKIDNAIQAFSGLSRSQYLGLQQEAERGNTAAIQQLDGLVDRFVAERGASLFGLDDAPAAYPVYNAYADYQGAVTAQGHSGVASGEADWGGRVSRAAGQAGVGKDGLEGYQAVRAGNEGFRSSLGGSAELGRVKMQSAQRDGEEWRGQAHRDALDAGLERLDQNGQRIADEYGVGKEFSMAKDAASWTADKVDGAAHWAGNTLHNTLEGASNLGKSMFGYQDDGAEKKSPVSDSGHPASQVGSGVSRYDAIIHEAAGRYNLNPNIIRAMMKQESGGDPNATSSKGAGGLMQLMPETAEDVARQEGMGHYDRYDPRDNIMMGAAYMKQQMDKYDGNLSLALAAYNAGPGSVDKYGGIPPFKETQNYVAKITQTYRKLEGTG